MSENPITHCEHGIDRAYRCIDCIEAERDALRAWAQELEVENLALQNVLSSQQRAPSLEKLVADLRRTELESLRASIVALAAGWDAMAKNHEHLMRITDSSVIMAEHRTAAHMFREHATELRQLGEGNGRD